MNLQALTTAQSGLSETENRFLDLHNRILFCGNMTMTYAVEFAKHLKEMRDGKLYTAAEYENFSDYVESAVGIKERQAYNYISVLEKLPQDFLQSNAKLGITKLALLASMPEEQRDEVCEKLDIENLSVKQLQKQISEKDATLDLLKDELAARDEKIAVMQSKFDGEKTILKDRVGELTEQLTESQRTAIADNENARKELERVMAEKDKALDELQMLKESQVEVQVETVTVENEETVAALEAANAKISELEQREAALKKKLDLSDDNLNKFKVKFEDLQRLGSEMLSLLNAMDATSAEKCKSAIKAVVGGWKL